jgi:hypothetical protein
MCVVVQANALSVRERVMAASASIARARASAPTARAPAAEKPIKGKSSIAWYPDVQHPDPLRRPGANLFCHSNHQSLDVSGGPRPPRPGVPLQFVRQGDFDGDHSANQNPRPSDAAHRRDLSSGKLPWGPCAACSSVDTQTFKVVPKNQAP